MANNPFGKTFDFDMFCPHCGTLCEAMTPIDQEPGARPTPGAVIICAYCGGISIVTADGLRDATRKEKAKTKVQLLKTFLPKII